VKVEAIRYGDRKVYSVKAFNRGIGSWLERLPTVWIEGEVTELRRQERWQSVFFTLKDPESGACLAATMSRRRFDALRLGLSDGERVHVFGRAELFEARGDFRLRVLSIERYGLGAHLAALERLKARLAAEGLFAAARKRPLPLLPRRIGLVTGHDAAAKRDVLTGITSRFPPARIVVAETYVQGPRAAPAIAEALEDLSRLPEVDVIVLARGGGGFEDLLPFSDERLVRAVAACPVPVVSAVGHEQDTPLCDLAADVRASTPTAAARLVVPDLQELLGGIDRRREALGRCTNRILDRERTRLAQTHGRLRSAPALYLERRRARLDQAGARLRALAPGATLERGYAIVRARGDIVRSSTALTAGERVDVELADGGFAGTVDEIR
jgi:exodeoxyribonuclease VII large subunit